MQLSFRPVQPKDTLGQVVQSLRIHMRDHKQRELAVSARTLEAHYGSFVLSQAHKGIGEARHLALTTSYGPSPRDTDVAGHPGRIYDIGPEPPPDDIDGRMPSVVTWCDGAMFYLIASHDLAPPDLLRVAVSVYR